MKIEKIDRRKVKANVYHRRDNELDKLVSQELEKERLKRQHDEEMRIKQELEEEEQRKAHILEMKKQGFIKMTLFFET